MKKVDLVFFMVLLSLFCSYNLIYSAGSSDNKDVLPRQRYISSQRQEVPQEAQNVRPIIPPAIPTPPPAISPTPSPHLSVPPVSQTTINIPSNQGVQMPQQPITMPVNIPTQPVIPATYNVTGELPHVPIIGNSIGMVVGIGVDKDSRPWIEVRDELFDEVLKIKINPATISVVKNAAKLSYREIKKGDMVNVIFNEDGEEKVASFISILTEEDLELMRGTSTSTTSQPNPETDKKGTQ